MSEHPAPMVERPPTRQGTQMTLVSSDESRHEPTPGLEEFVAILGDIAQREPFVGEHPEIGFLAAELLPRFVGT